MGSSKYNSGGDVYNVAKIILHPNFDYFELRNDACIVVLEETPTNMSVKRYHYQKGAILLQLFLQMSNFEITFVSEPLLFPCHPQLCLFLKVLCL